MYRLTVTRDTSRKPKAKRNPTPKRDSVMREARFWIYSFKVRLYMALGDSRRVSSADVRTCALR